MTQRDSILLGLGVVTAYDILTTVYGTVKLLGASLGSVIAALILGGVIGGFLYFSFEIHEMKVSGFPFLIKPLWGLAFLYDLWTSFIGNNRFIIPTEMSPEEWPRILLLFGLTLFVSACPAILSYLRNNVQFMRGR